MIRARRYAAAALAAILILVSLLLPLAAAACSLRHNCCGENCAVCRAIDSVMSSRTARSRSIFLLSCCIGAVLLIFLISGESSSKKAAITPVLLRTKLLS